MTLNRHLTRSVQAAVLVAALFTTIGCERAASQPTPEEVPAQAGPPVLELSAHPVRVEEIVEPIQGTGTIAAHKTTNVGPHVDGIIEEIFVQVSDRVSERQPLFRTRAAEYQTRVAEAEAAERLGRAEVAKAQLDHRRARELQEQAVVPVESFDQAKTAHEIAFARYEQAKARLAEARRQLEDTVVRAPYAGVITQRFVDEGAMVRTMLSSNSPVVQIMKTDIVVAIVHVPEIHLPEIAVGTPAKVTIDGLRREIDSEVFIINDRVEHQSHAIELRLPMRNTDLSIKPGLFAKATILPAPRSAVVLDRANLLGSGERRYVFVENEGRAVRRDVRVRDLDAELVEVLGGLDSGEQVLGGPNLSSVTDGAAVTSTSSDQSAPPQSASVS